MNQSELENFNLYIDWIMTTLKTQDKLVMEAFKRGISTLVSPECMREVTILAFYQLAEIDRSTCIWALHHYDTQLFLELKQNITNYAVRQLLNHGFILGQDFSSLPNLGLLVHPTAKPVLLKDIPPFVSLILQEILHTLEPDPIQ